MLLTKHDGSVGMSNKPTVVEDYNKMKGFVDLSDQMAAYTPFIRKTTKWYMKIFFHLLTQTALVNAWVLYNMKTRMKLNTFKYTVAKAYLKDNRGSSQRRKRKLIENRDMKTDAQRHCTCCYEMMMNTHGRAHANSHAKKVRTQCSICEQFVCLDCFQIRHTSCVSP